MGLISEITPYLPDLVLVAGVGYVTWCGWKKGLFIELFSLAILALAIFLGLTQYDLLTRFIEPYFKSAPVIALLLSFLLTCFLVYKLFSLLGQKLKKVLHDTPFGIFDHVAGSLFALAKVTLAIYSVYWSVSRFAQPQFDSFLEDHKVCRVLVNVGKTEFNWVRSGVTTLVSGSQLPSMEDLTTSIPVLDKATENP